MIEREKINLIRINELIDDIKQNRGGIKLTKKCLEQNHTEQTKKVVNLSQVTSSLKEEVLRMNSLIYMQHSKVNSLSSKMNIQKIAIVKDKANLKEKSHVLERDNKTKKIEIMNTIGELGKIKKTKLNKENYSVKMILGLEIIKK